MTPETQSKAARQRNELRAQAETIARLRREKMELTRDLRAAAPAMADRIEALEAENARLRVVLMQMVGATVYLPHDGFSKPHEHESSRIARAVIEEISDD